MGSRTGTGNRSRQRALADPRLAGWTFAWVLVAVMFIGLCPDARAQNSASPRFFAQIIEGVQSVEEARETLRALSRSGQLRKARYKSGAYEQELGPRQLLLLGVYTPRADGSDALQAYLVVSKPRDALAYFKSGAPRVWSSLPPGREDAVTFDGPTYTCAARIGNPAQPALVTFAFDVLDLAPRPGVVVRPGAVATEMIPGRAGYFDPRIPGYSPQAVDPRLPRLPPAPATLVEPVAPAEEWVELQFTNADTAERLVTIYDQLANRIVQELKLPPRSARLVRLRRGPPRVPVYQVKVFQLVEVPAFIDRSRRKGAPPPPMKQERRALGDFALPTDSSLPQGSSFEISTVQEENTDPRSLFSRPRATSARATSPSDARPSAPSAPSANTPRAPAKTKVDQARESGELPPPPPEPTEPPTAEPPTTEPPTTEPPTAEPPTAEPPTKVPSAPEGSLPPPPPEPTPPGF